MYHDLSVTRFTAYHFSTFGLERHSHLTYNNGVVFLGQAYQFMIRQLNKLIIDNIDKVLLSFHLLLLATLKVKKKLFGL